jgi:anaerobic magnesium-protoporphyrin IX monomethyl ester cyclase
MARVLFVYTNSLGIPYIDLGLAYLSAVLKKAGHTVGLVDFTFGLSDAAALEQVKAFRPDWVGFTARTNEFERAVQVARKIKQRLDVPIFCGGMHPTVAAEDAIARRCFDGICLGEGEHATLELIERMERGEDHTTVEGYWFRRDGEVIRNALAPLTPDLDALPPYDLSLFSYERYLMARDRQLDFITARGCPFKCSYCVDHTLQEMYRGTGKYTRARTIPGLIAELKEHIARWKIKRITIADEMFNIHKKRLREFCDAYAAEIGLPFECDLRADCCNEEVFKSLKAANCVKVNIGLESGDESLRMGILRKGITDAELTDAFRLAREHGIQTLSYNIIGLPTETKAQIEKSIELNRKVKPDSIQCSIFTPYPGTELLRYARDHDLLKRSDYTNTYYTGVYLKGPDYSDAELLWMRTTFAYNCVKEESLPKALMLFLREVGTPVYAKVGRKVPPVVNQMIYRLFWHNQTLKFMAK